MSDVWVDYRQNRRIRDLEDDLASARYHAAQQSRTLRSELAKVRGNLESKLNRLAEAFDAFVSLSDLREDLAVFGREAAIRRRARHLVLGLAERATNPDIPPPPSIDEDDVPNYWLGPATEALAALVRQDPATSEDAAAEARRRDAHRTAAFLTLGLAVAGQPALATPWLEDAFPALDASTTRVQRLLWHGCGAGTYGDLGRQLAARRLADFVASLPSDQVESLAGAWRAALPKVDKNLAPASLRGAGATGSPHRLDPNHPLLVPRHGQRLIGALYEHCEQVLAPEGRRTATIESQQAPQSAESPPATEAHAELLRALIDEGSADERPLLRRAAELRREVDEDGAHPDPWDKAVGDTVELVRSDAFGEHPEPRAIAWRACGPVVMRLADDLAAQAAAPLPDELTIRAERSQVRIRPREPVSASLIEARERIASATPDHTDERLGMAMIVGGLPLAGLAVAAGWFLLLVGAALSVAGLVVWRKGRAELRDHAAWVAASQRKLDEAARAAAEDFADYRATVERERVTATAVRDKIAALFT